MNRREWMQRASSLALGCALSGAVARADNERSLPEPTPAKLPRWRGFNLLSMFNVANKEPFPEEDFALIAELGFDFVRLPLDYRCWAAPGDWTKVDESALEPIDRAVDYGRKHGIHVQINFHRAPGYTVAQPAEARSLWKDPEALDACARHWATFARRYAGIPNAQLDFNLFNEPDNRVDPGDHRRVVERVAGAIREVDPGRLIVCDGRSWARIPPTELDGLNVAAALHGYDPHRLTHYRASWVGGSDRWPVPTWPLKEGGEGHDKEALRREKIEPWKALEARGVGVMVGEFGSHDRTPHDVVLAWMRDCLDLYREAGWGWALWNFRGSFGILDSRYADASYDDWRGHRLDRAMLELLQAS